MPFPPHYLLSWGGDFVSDPTEIWTNNLRLAKDDNLDGASHQSFSSSEMESKLDAVATQVSNHVLSTGAGYSSNTRLRWVKLNEIDGQGRYKSTTDANTKFLTTPVVSQSGVSPYPLATALVITFLTSAERGPASRGRVFVPQPQTAQSTSTYRITAANCQNVALAWRTFLDAIDIGGTANPIVPAVVSDRGATGVARTINQTQVGDVLDYMGSRRNRLKETRYTSTSFN